MAATVDQTRAGVRPREEVAGIPSVKFHETIRNLGNAPTQSVINGRPWKLPQRTRRWIAAIRLPR